MPDAPDATPLPPLALPGSIWDIRPDLLPRLVEAHRVPAGRWTHLAAHVPTSKPQTARQVGATERAGGAVAVLPLTGVLSPRGSFLSLLMSGGYGSLMDFREAFRDAVTSPDIGAIVIDVDSPGGLHALVPETAAEVLAARGTKPIIAVANTMAGSGAYWIASQADELVVTPSGDVGSVGVYVYHEDWSAWNEQAGINPTYIYAGKYKVEGNPEEPLSDEALAYYQQEVDAIYTEFLEGVAAGRNTTAAVIRADYGEGRTLRAPDALNAGMVDRVATLEDVIADLLNAPSGGRASARARIVSPAPRAEATPPHPGPEGTEPPAPPAPPADPAPPEGEPEGTPPADPPPPASETPAEATQPSDDDRAAIADALLT